MAASSFWKTNGSRAAVSDITVSGGIARPDMPSRARRASHIHYHGPAMNAFGTSAPFFRLNLKGRIVADNLIQGEGYEPEHAGQKLPFRLVWRAYTGEA
jgi:hypothetical protein